MLRKIKGLFLILLIAVIAISCINNNYKQQVNIFQINDTHGAFVTDDNTIGMEKIASILSSLEKSNNQYVKIANGDMLQGTYISNIHYGKPIIEALNLLKFDAFVLGNHEFDWGIEEIAKYKDGDLSNGEADFPFLAANIVNKNTKERLDWTDQYVILQKNGYKIGLMGFIGKGLESSIAEDKVKDYEFLDPVPIARELAKKLRTEDKCDVVLVSVHGYSTMYKEDYAELEGDERIDAVITGHTHQQIEEEYPRYDDYVMPLIQSRTKNISAGEIIILMDSNKKPISATIKHYDPKSYKSDAKMEELIQEYSKDIDHSNEIVTYTPNELYEGTLGREMADAMVDKYQAAVAFINTGGVRAKISTGNIRIKDIYEVFPFDNKIITTTMKGSDLRLLCIGQQGYLYFNSGFNVGNIIDSQNYKIVTIDYVYTSVHQKQYFENTTPHYEETFMRDVLIEYWKKSAK